MVRAHDVEHPQAEQCEYSLGIVAYLLDPLVDWFHKKRGMQRQSAIILVFTIALMLVGGLVASIVPALIGQATKLTTEFPKKAKVFQQTVTMSIQFLPMDFIIFTELTVNSLRDWRPNNEKNLRRCRI